MQNLPFDWSHTLTFEKGALASKWSTIFYTTIFGSGTNFPTILRFYFKFIRIKTNIFNTKFKILQCVWKILSRTLHLINNCIQFNNTSNSSLSIQKIFILYDHFSNIFVAVSVSKKKLYNYRVFHTILK